MLHLLAGKPARTLFIFAALLALAAGVEGGIPAEEAADISTDLDALLDRLADRAEEYERFALGFTCEESVVRSSYKAEKGTFKKRDREVYDYLFAVNDKTGRLEEIRELVEENGKPVRRSVRKLNLEMPPAYAWSQIFARRNRGKFFFKLAGRLIQGYRLLIQVDFAGTGAVPGEEEIAGWSGRASIDSETLNLHSIQAEPSGQAARVEAETLKYQRAFAIMGVPLASRPTTRTLTVTFGFGQEGLTYPAVATLMKSVYVSSAELGLEEKIVLRYRDYRFFEVGTKVDEARDEPAEVETPPAGVPADPNGAPE